ncbi:hypothetical protein CEP54_013101 [Fusarium duplospermum]|uniref:Uncharacterized protein n=1 Tax=Fusarium duplospermum TaxID=1325734 RepID=A0A428P524_9HYPO|nr:hypothetical protein CEP54_013101 [Fusarium duplospermum]
MPHPCMPAIALAALDREKYRDIAASTSLFIFLDCLHRATTQFEVVNRVTQWLSRAVDMRSPILLSSIDTLAAAVTEVNELFLETKLPQFVRVASIYSTESSSKTPLTEFRGSFGTFDERLLHLTNDGSHEKAKVVIVDLVEEAASSLSDAIKNQWLQVLHFLSPPAQPVSDKPWSKDSPLNWILESNAYSKWRKTTGPLALQLYGPKASDPLRAFYEDEQNQTRNKKRLVFYFTFDFHDSRRNSALAMATSFIAQILSASEAPAFSGRLFRQRWFFRAWSLYDALYTLTCLFYGMEIFLDVFSDLVLQTENKFKLLVTTKDMFADWPGESLNTERNEPISSNPSDVRPPDAQIAHDAGDVAASPRANKGNESGEDRAGSESENRQQKDLGEYIEALVADTDVPGAAVQDVVHLVRAIPDASLRDALLTQFLGPASVVPVETLLSLEKPITPESFFRHVLDRVPEPKKQLAREVLSWALCSVRPLGVQELGTVVFWIQQREVLDGSTMTKDYGLRLLSPIANLLWGILVIRNNEVGISHPVLRDLLLGPGTEWYRIGQDGHQQIVLSCLDLLKQQDFVTWKDKNKGVQCSLGTDDVLLSRSMFEDRTTLHQYVIMNWPKHYRKIQSKRPRSEVADFFKGGSGSAWQSWAESRWIMASPMDRVDRPETLSGCALALLAEIGDLELLRSWVDDTGSQSTAGRGIALVEASRAGMKDVVEYLLELEHGHPQQPHLQAALSAAASSAESEVLMVLILSAPESFAWPASLLVRVSELGFEDCVNALLSRGCLPDAPVDFPNMTALLRAARNGRAGICSLLFEYGADADISGGHGAVMAMSAGSACGADVVKTLAAHKIDVKASDTSNNSALNESSRLGHFKVARALADIVEKSENKPELSEIEKYLDRAADLNFVQTAAPLLDILCLHPETQPIMDEQLSNAVRDGRVEFARLLLQKGADANYQPWLSDGSLLWEACNSLTASIDMLELLMNNGAELNPLSQSQTPLMAAARKGRLECLKYLVDHGADVHRADFAVYSPLSEAARGGSLECVRWLLDKGAEIDWRDTFGESALFEAAAAGHFEVADFLLDQGAAASGSGWKGRTVLSLCLPSMTTMRKVLGRCPDTDIKEDNGLAPIHQAALGRKADAIDVLLEFKADVDIEGPEDYDQHTPLIMATINGDLESVQSLLEGGADVDHVAKRFGCTALQHAKTPVVIGALLQHRPDVDLADNEGRTALGYRTSIAEPDLAAIKKLVNARVNVNTVCKDGCCTPLWNIASRSGNWPITEYLISKGADLNATSFQGGSVLHRACFRGNTQMVKHLHAAGAKADLGVGGTKGSPLQAACLGPTVDHDVLDIIRYLVVDAKADVNQVCGLYGTALSVACLRNSPDALKLLLEYGAAMDLADQAGRLPIHFAAATCFDSFQHLINLGCDVYAADKTGRTVLQWAAQSGDVEIVRLILKYPDMAVDQTDKDGWTALCWAARGMTSQAIIADEKSPDAQAEIIDILLKHDASKLLSVRGDADQTWSPLQIAAFHNSGAKILIGTIHTCKSCENFDFCFKCYFHREEIHDPSHEFEKRGPTFDEEDVAEDDASDESSGLDSEESESSIETIGV